MLPRVILLVVMDILVCNAAAFMSLYIRYEFSFTALMESGYLDVISKYMVRHFSKPGITGWAQVTGYRGETKELWQMEERIKRDIWYNENWSFKLDLEIIFRTAVQIFSPNKNAY